MGLLLPAINNAAKGFFTHRLIDIFIEDYAMMVASEGEDGPLVQVKIRRTSDQVLVLTENLSGYSDEVDISGLPSGTYSAKVYTTLTNYTEVFGK